MFFANLSGSLTYLIMSKVCYICNKQQSSGNNVSHSKRRTKRTFGANLISTKLAMGGRQKSVMVCARCLKTLTKPAVPSRAIKRAAKKAA